jgi:quercetin dioxygenase-like cupin family protein
VLEGEICFQTEHYEPAILGVGDSIYINSSMQHAAYSTSEEDAVVLWVNTG